MSKAFKCNRCHKCFDPSDNPDDIFVQAKDIYASLGKYYNDVDTIGKSYEERIPSIDLCKECSKMFVNFLNNDDSRKEQKDEETSSSNTDDGIMSDFNKSVNDFLKDIGSRGAAILREYIYGSDRKSETSERKSNAEENRKN